MIRKETYWDLQFLRLTFPDRFVHSREDLIVESLEPLDSVHHRLQLDPLEVLIHPVNPLNSENVVAEVEALKPPLLTQEGHHDDPGPDQPVAKDLLHGDVHQGHTLSCSVVPSQNLVRLLHVEARWIVSHPILHLIVPHIHTEDKLECRPQSVKLFALVDVDHLSRR